MNVYPFIEAENASDSGNVKRTCELLKVSRAAYYTQKDAEPTPRQRRDTQLTEQITTIHDKSRGTYGAPRVHAELREQGHRHSRKRVARLMRQTGIAGRAPKRWRKTTVPDPASATPADLIQRDFSCAATDVNTRWCGDITYTGLDWSGLPATLIDCRARKGQSGSPVVFYADDLAQFRSADGQIRSGPAWDLIGIYSGRIHKDSDVGIVWKRSAIEAIVERGTRPDGPDVCRLDDTVDLHTIADIVA